MGANTMKTAIVIGATGLIGSELVGLLAASSKFDKVVTLTRRAMTLNDDKVENHVIDFDRLSDKVALFNGDFLFSCLGTTAKVAGSTAAQRTVDLDYQLTAAKLAAQQGVAHYLLVSSSGANSKSRNAYLKMKGELEDKIKSLPFAQISIFQPSLLLGRREEFRLAETAASVVMPFVCRFPGLRAYRPIEGHDVAKKMLSVATQPRSSVVRVFRLDEIFPD